MSEEEIKPLVSPGFASSGWKPNAETVKILNYAMAQIQSVPYKTSSRWTFYRCLQAGLFPDKSHINKFDYATSRARKSFYGLWCPYTLIDSIRQSYFKGEYICNFNFELDTIEEQPFIMQCWYEARAMHRQFQHYTNSYRVTLVPFGGDISIAMKWDIAKKLEALYEEYHKSIIILYFGDYDRKGFQILDAALKDIKAWSKVPFTVDRVGLTLEQVKAFNIPENPDHPNAYQWEALDDSQAKQLILTGIEKYLKPVPDVVEQAEKVIRHKCVTAIKQILQEELDKNEG